jgi:hypothetical protein
MFRRRVRVPVSPLEAPRLPMESFRMPDFMLLRNKAFREAFEAFSEMVREISDTPEADQKAHAFVRALAPAVVSNIVDGVSLEAWLLQNGTSLNDWGGVLVRSAALGLAIAHAERELGLAEAGLTTETARLAISYAEGGIRGEETPTRIRMLTTFLIEAAYFYERNGGGQASLERVRAGLG